MIRIETLVLWRVLHVAFTMNDFGEIDDVAVGLTEASARDRCFARNLNRTTDHRKDPTR